MLFTDAIKDNRDFSYLYRKGQTVVTRAVVVYFRRNQRPYNRIGLTSSKKIGNAVKRNRARRVIRAAYRELEVKFPIGFDIIFVARGAATAVKTDFIKKSFRDRVIPEMIKAIK